MKIHTTSDTYNVVSLLSNRKIQIALIVIGILGLIFAGLYAFKKPFPPANTHTDVQELDSKALKEILDNGDNEKLISICRIGINHKALDEIYLENINAFKYITNDYIQAGNNVFAAITVIQNAPSDIVIKHINEIKWDAKYTKTRIRSNVNPPEFPLQDAFINRFKNASLANIPHLEDHIPDSIRTLLAK